MVERTKLEPVVDGDFLSQGYFNQSNNKLIKGILINKLNTTATYEDMNSLVDDLTSDSADTSTNWTYNSTDDQYENKQTSAATLEWNDLLSEKQKKYLEGDEKTVLLWVDMDVPYQAETATILNNSFETAGAGGADVFANWDEATSGQTITRSTDQASEGTYSCKITGQNTNVSGTYTGEVTQSIDVTNIDTIYCDAIHQGIGSSVSASSVTVECGPVSVSVPGTATFIPIELDVSGLTGVQTLGCYSSFTKSGTINGGKLVYFDNFRYIPTAATATEVAEPTLKVSPNGSTAFETVSNGELFNFSTSITDIGVQIIENRADADIGVFSKIKAIGVFLV